MPTLVVTSGPLAGERIELTGELIVGREHADLTIDDPEISRRHAAIRLTEGGVQVQDLGSTNGTLVDGVRIEAPVTLGGGARLQFGETTIEIEADAIVDDSVTRLSERPPAQDLTVMRSAPPEATAAYTAPPAESTPSDAPPVEPVVAQAPLAEAPPPSAPPRAPAPQRGQPGVPDQPFGAFAPPAGRRRTGVATRLWVPAVLTFATVAGTAIALILYFAGR